MGSPFAAEVLGSTGVDYVCVDLQHGLSDFDGAMIPAGIGNAAGLQNLVEIMRARGFGEPLIEKLCLRNWLRVLGQTWGRARPA